jgi:hypothetical protein
MSRNAPLVGACILLLGTPVLPAALSAERLRGAFRRMALATHPDAHRRDPRGRDFIRVQEAYELLRRHVNVATVRPASPAASTARPAAAKPTGAWYWKGGVPNRKLRLGEYLFFTGTISWDMMIAAIVGQRRSRPRLGQLARDRSLLDGSGLAAALAARMPGERLGEVVQRLGLLTPLAVEGLLVEQRRAQKPLGRQLVALGGIQRQDLLRVLARHRQHNRAVAARR